MYKLFTLCFLLILSLAKAQTFKEKIADTDSLADNGSKLITWSIKFYFVSDSIVTDESNAYINSLADFLKTNDVSIEIGVHSMPKGSDVFNNNLTVKRAKKISEILISKGIEPKRLTAKGFGKTKPIFVAKPTGKKCSHCNDELERKNLRVEFKIIKPY